MNTGHGTGAGPVANQRGSKAEIKIDETLVSGQRRGSQPALSVEWLGCVGRVAAIKPEFCGFNFNPV